MRKFHALSVLIAVALAMTPRFAEAGPCSHDIAGLETSVRLFGSNPPSGQQDHQPRSDLANRLQLQFAATMVRAKRLDMEGERFACIGALNAARRIYVFVAKQ
jgi:hypothetical protein